MAKFPHLLAVVLLALGLFAPVGSLAQKTLSPEFHTSDRCLACHNGITTPSGKDVSIGFDWRASVMANSARDPYWQASVRREDIDHPQFKAEIEDGCADCHMPMSRYQSKLKGELGQVFAHLPFEDDPQNNAAAEDGVSCSVCHQITKDKLGTRASFNGGFVVKPPEVKDDHPEYGPFAVENGQAHIMQTSTGGFRPTQAKHIQDSALCATCHTLYTKSISASGKDLGFFPEQMPFLEWQHSDYSAKNSCQDCHMPKVEEPAPIAAVFGPLRSGVRQHTFVGANFFLLSLLNSYRNDLSVSALPVELTAEAERTRQFLQTQAARVTIQSLDLIDGKLKAAVLVQNLTGHKLPTAFPSRRVWVHFLLRDRDGRILFESGAMNPDGSIQGNDNDTDPARFEPYYREITRADQVQIYEPILKDEAGQVTTGLAAAAGYLKDDRLLPSGFNKQNAGQDISVVGDALEDSDFTDSGNLVHYSIETKDARGPFSVSVELWYQPIGFRWAHNLSAYPAMETNRFLGYYDSMSSATAIVLAKAEATR